MPDPDFDAVLNIADDPSRALKTNPTLLREIVQCQICTTLMTQPFTMLCGHTFCGPCISSWTKQKRQQSTCPTCRRAITTEPVLNLAVRSLALTLVDTYNSLPTTEIKIGGELLQLPKPEELFDKFLFMRPMYDEDELIYRCPQCNHEIDGDGECTNCGLQFELSDSDYQESDSMGVEEVSEDEMDSEDRQFIDDGDIPQTNEQGVIDCEICNVPMLPHSTCPRCGQRYEDLVDRPIVLNDSGDSIDDSYGESDYGSNSDIEVIDVEQHNAANTPSSQPSSRQSRRPVIDDSASESDSDNYTVVNDNASSDNNHTNDSEDLTGMSDYTGEQESGNEDSIGLIPTLIETSGSENDHDSDHNSDHNSDWGSQYSSQDQDQDQDQDQSNSDQDQSNSDQYADPQQNSENDDAEGTLISDGDDVGNDSQDDDDQDMSEYDSGSDNGSFLEASNNEVGDSDTRVDFESENEESGFGEDAGAADDYDDYEDAGDDADAGDDEDAGDDADEDAGDYDDMGSYDESSYGSDGYDDFE